MGSTFIITATWWADTGAASAWPLLAEHAGCPRWWSSIAHTETLRGRERPLPAWPWRAALGRPLHLAVATLASQPQHWLTLRLQGDLQGQATFMLEPAAHTGLDITCRCELSLPRSGRPSWALLFQRCMRRLLATLSEDLGRALHCSVRPLGAWQGYNWTR